MVKLPDQFSDLQGLADIFAIADDIDRDRVESESSAQQKRDLVARVWPKLDLINQWLDSHDDEEAHFLGRLAEATCEVALEISHS